jgi:hypothetical protein
MAALQSSNSINFQEVLGNAAASYLVGSAMSGSANLTEKKGSQMVAVGAANALWQLGIADVKKFLPKGVAPTLAQGLSQGVAIWGLGMVMPGGRTQFMPALVQGTIAAYGGQLVSSQI